MIRIERLRPLSVVFLLLCLAVVPSAGAQPPTLRLLVPAYANPCCADMWDRLIDTAGTLGEDLIVILNPNSGPGASPIDPNFVMPTGLGPLVDLDGAGGAIIGYVKTEWAGRPIADVQADIDRYYDPAFYRGAGVLVDGIFFDEMSNDLADVGYYEMLRDYVRSLDASAFVVGNPGTTFVNNPSSQMMWTASDYAESMDMLVTFEVDADAYRTNYTPPVWLDDYPAERFAHIVHTEVSVADMLNSLGLAIERKASTVYVTEDVLGNPYDQIPKYWSEEVDSALGFDLLFADGFERGDLSAWMP